MESRKKKFIDAVFQAQTKKAENSQLLSREKYDGIVGTLERIAASGAKSPKDYRLQARYQLLEVQGLFQLIRKGTEKHFICVDDMFDVIDEAHKATGHGGRNVVEQCVKQKYANVSRDHILRFIELCEECQLKKTKVRKSIVVKPMVSNHMNSRCQVCYSNILYCCVFLCMLYEILP